MKTLAISLFCLLTTASTVLAQDELITIRLQGNRITKVVITGITSNAISYRVTRTQGEAQLPFSQIESIEWPEPEPWEQAVNHFHKMEYKEAAALFEKFPLAPQRFTKHPAPGNFTTRARRMLLEIYRIQMDGKSLASHFDALQPELQLLPPAERRIPPAVEGWIAESKKDWPTIETLAGKHPFDPEVAYLAGLAHLEENDTSAADFAFTKAYTLDVGGNTTIARKALQQSIKLKPTSPKVHTYANLFGKGKLWSDAPSPATDLLKEPLKSDRPVLGEEEGAGDSGKFDTPEEKAKRVEKIE